MDKDSTVKATASASSTAPQLCGNCGQEPRAKGHSWCAKCKAEAQRNYDADREAGIEERGFHKGCEAMRDHLLTGLRKANPSGMMRAGEILTWVIETPAPSFKARTQSST